MNEDLLELIYRFAEEDLEKNIKEQERRLDYACRHLIPHRIRGVVTKGKFKYRGLYLERRGDSVFPILCGKESRSGKRKSFRIDLNFEGYDLFQYESLMEFERFREQHLVSFNYSKRDVWEIGGIANQITTNNE
jgi:hypothetical protein